MRGVKVWVGGTDISQAVNGTKPIALRMKYQETHHQQISSLCRTVALALSPQLLHIIHPPHCGSLTTLSPEGLETKAGLDPLKDDKKLESFKLAVSSMLTTALKDSQTFIEKQFTKFETQLENTTRGNEEIK